MNDIVKQVAGSMALSWMELTDTDKERIEYLLDHPEEEDAILQELFAKHQKEGTT